MNQLIKGVPTLKMYNQADYYDPEFDDNYPVEEEYDEYNQNGNYYQNTIPDVVKSFLAFLQESIESRNIYNLQNLYENTFPKLSESYYDKKSWPEENKVEMMFGKL